MKRLLKEPLLHFLVLGSLLFGLYSFVGKKETVEPAKIVVSAAQVENLSRGFARVWQRPPTARELQGLIEDHIRTEVYYREGKSLGLDRDDIVIRRRLQLKMEVMAEDAAAAEPSEEELREYLAAHPDKFRSEDRVTFRHVFFSASRRAAPGDDARQVIAKLAAADREIDFAALGDSFLLGDTFRAMTRSEASRTFGGDFANQLVASEPGRWQGPIASGYGSHFIFVDERMPGTLPPLDPVRQAVSRELINARRAEAQQKLYRTLRDRYEITVEGLPVEPARRDDRVGATK
jgi:hypothetical protein